MSFNQLIFQSINGLSGKHSSLDLLGVFLAQYLAYFLIVGCLSALIFIRDWRLKFYTFSLVALSVILARGILTELIRFIYYRARPFLVLPINPLIAVDNSAGFPSGHAAVFFALAAAVFYLNRKWGIVLLISAAVMGLARVFVGVHWPLDILGGAVVGLLSAVIAHQIMPESFKKFDV